MIKIKISSKALGPYFYRQSPSSQGIWGNGRFYVNDEIDEVDFWIVYGSLPGQEKIRCTKGNTVFMTGEPPSLKQYHAQFLNQFGTIITCHRDLDHPNVIQTQTGLPWLYGLSIDKDKNIRSMSDYDSLKATKPIRKEKLLSVITSAKVSSEGHRLRLEFVKALSNHFGQKIDLYGQGIYDIDEKSKALDDYKYHVVMENSSFPDYWTEKIADSYLARGYPFYFGAPNISDYFPIKSFTAIDIHDFEHSIRIIEKAIERNLFEKSIEEREAARNLILDKYNFFAMMSEYCQKNLRSGSPKVTTVLRPRRKKRLVNMLRSRLNFRN